MTFPALEARDVLVADGVGASSGATWPIKVGPLTSQPDAVIAIIDAPGQSPNPKWLLDFPAIQVVVRGKPDDYPTAKAKADEVKDALLGIDAFTTPAGNRWDGVTMMGDVNYLGPDENSRPQFSLNFRIIREPATSTLTSREPL
jgi:hypothetical protein